MAEYLSIESLAVRDASWREAQETPADRVSLSSSPPGIQSGVRPQASSMPEQVARVERRTSFGAKASKATTRRLGLWIVLAALAAGAGSAAVIGLFPRGAPENVSRLVVIEKQGVDPNEPAPGAPAVENAAPAPVAVASVPSTASATSPSAASAAARTASAPTPDRGAVLARAFQKQEGKIQSCFQQHGDGATGTPNISVRFQIDASGAVQNAIASPSSVAGTPVGQCSLGVARGTNFGPQPEPISCSSPIAARVVRR
jgi:hypothetical protein